jgi:hypothetical protein
LNSRPPDYESGALPLSYCGKFFQIVILACVADLAPMLLNGSESKALAARLHPRNTCHSRSKCPGADSNRYALRHHPLKMACLPISPPGQNHSFPATAQSLKLRAYSENKTGPTGLEPATSRVTVECSNQTELRPQLLESGSETPFSPRTCLEHGSVVNQSALQIAPRGIEPLSAP